MQSRMTMVSRSGRRSNITPTVEMMFMERLGRSLIFVSPTMISEEAWRMKKHTSQPPSLNLMTQEVVWSFRRLTFTPAKLVR